jgi:hypothetical protein
MHCVCVYAVCFSHSSSGKPLAPPLHLAPIELTELYSALDNFSFDRHNNFSGLVLNEVVLLIITVIATTQLNKLTASRTYLLTCCFNALSECLLLTDL